jgi:hypothetical protein
MQIKVILDANTHAAIAQPVAILVWPARFHGTTLEFQVGGTHWIASVTTGL